MPIRIKTDLDFGQTIYIKTDPDQVDHTLIGIKVVPPNQIKFILSCYGEICELYDFECSTVRDDEKFYESKSKDED